MIKLFDFWEASRLPMYFQNTDIKIKGELANTLKDETVDYFEVDVRFNIRVWLYDVTEEDIRKAVMKC